MSDKQSHLELDAIFEKLVSDGWKAAIGELVRDEPEKARAIMRALDEMLHPWGEPGVVPDVPRDGGKLWFYLPYGAHHDPSVPMGVASEATAIDCATQQREYTICIEESGDDLPEWLIVQARFRKRWIPRAP